MRKIGLISCGLVILSVFFSASVFACSSDADCSGNQKCVDTTPNDGNNSMTCESQGAGLTVPGCSISLSSNVASPKMGDRINVSIKAWDNGEVYFRTQPTLSGACSSLVGFCPIGANVCSAKGGTSASACSVCGSMYLVGNRTGICTVTASVYNNAGQSLPCSGTINIGAGDTPSCPAKIELTGKFSGNPSQGCVDVYDISGTRKTVGKYCGINSWKSAKLDSGREYEIIPRTISGYKVKPTSVKTGKTCGDANANFKFTKESVVVPPPPPPPPQANASFCQTFNGNVTAKEDLSDSNLLVGAISKGVKAKSEAGIVSGAPINLTSESAFSENGNGKGFNLDLSDFDSKEIVPSYDSLLNVLLKNMGFPNVAAIPSCPNGDFDWPPFHIWCYSSDLNSKILAAVNREKTMPDPDIKFFVFVPSANLSTNQSLTTNFTGSNEINATMLAFVPGDGSKSLRLMKDLQVKEDQKSALMAIINGGMMVDSGVNLADGFYYFSGPFNDGVSDEKIAGSGSLIGIGEEAFSNPNGLMRRFTPQAAETWTFHGKYLSLFQNLLSRPKFFWKELPAN